MRKEGSLLFVNKKKQKNFIPVRALAPPCHKSPESFLVLFCKKEHLPCFDGARP
jgi:hypothetical protein